MSTGSQPLYGRWMHSREEDAGDARVYRRPDYRFPPSRGRTGFDIRDDGTFVAIGIGPGDGQKGRRGRWRHAGDGNLHVTYDDGEEQTLRIVAVADDVLRITT
jgi:hypothetical protein